MTESTKAPGDQELSGDGLGDASGQGTEAQADSSGEPELERTRAELLDMTNRYFRTQAEFDNYRKRIAREKEELAVFANQRLILTLLPVLDNLERALATPKSEGDDKLRQGVELTARSFRDILAKESVTPIEAVGQPFDPNLHEAVMTVDSEEHEDGTVILEFQRGYRLGDRVIRPSMVQVTKKG